MTTATSLDVDDALEGERENGGVGLPRPDLDDDDEHADEASFGHEAAWPEPVRTGRVAQIGCDLRLSGPPDPSRPAEVATPGDQTAWQAHGGAAAERTGR